MYVSEMLRRQGMDPEKLNITVPTTEIGKLIGNSMSVNVVQRLLHKLCMVLGFLPEDAIDTWHSGEMKSILTQSGKRPDRVIGECTVRGEYNEPRKFLVDSGAGLHVVSLKSLSKREKASSKTLDVPQSQHS